MAKKPIKSIDLLPEFLRTDKNRKFLSSTIDQLIQPPKLERLDGFIGSKLTPTYNSETDVYVSETLPLRRDYQLEPALIVRNPNATVKDAVAIDDLANSITTEGGFDNNFDRLFRSEVYSFNPHIDFDKFVNYQKYYWLPTGPETITITGKQLNSSSTFSVRDNEIESAWIFSPDGLTEDPTIFLYRGNTYTFDVSSKYNFFIKVAPSLGLDDVYDVNVTGNGTNSGSVTIVVDENTPSTLYYTSDTVNFLQGKFVIKQATEDAFIDVEKEIIGKKTYVSGQGVALSNGMKVRFEGEVFPESYKDKEFFVEGVGKQICLVDYSLLTVSETLTAQYDDDFDASNFDEYPYDSFKQLPLNPEYITINRASQDLNPWSRYNRWVHEDVIRLSAELNGIEPVIPADKRAKRPIIEFIADLQLFNFGSVGLKNVDLIDNETLDAFSLIEGSAGYYVDGVLLEQGHRVIFNADTDFSVRSKIFEVNYTKINNRFRLELRDTGEVLTLGSSLGVNLGNNFKGNSWWFDGNAWRLAQQHTHLNQPPLFDVFDSNGISFRSGFYETNFTGTQVFGYEVGTGTVDPVLGFPLSYQNTISVGSFRFKNYFDTDLISVFERNEVSVVNVSQNYLRINSQSSPSFVNVWSLAEPYEIPILQLTSVSSPTNKIELNAIDDPTNVEFRLQVFVDGYKLPDASWTVTEESRKSFVNFVDTVEAGKNVLFKIFTVALANENGQYETPISLTNNPLNGTLETVTLTEMSDHLKTMSERDPAFSGEVFGNNNVRDLPDIFKYGSRLISNPTPIAFANFFLGVKEHSAADAIQRAADQYGQFKLSLFKKIAEVGDSGNAIDTLDRVITELNSDKDLNSAWFWSDMVPYGTDRTTRTWSVTDVRNKVYPISNDFDPTSLTYRSVLVYLNGVQLLLDKDYHFLVNDSSVELLIDLAVGDQLRIDDYFDASGSYVPMTPTKLGLYPKFQPSIYVDTTYVTPTTVIQGHDGSITVAFNDFRDDVILEFEKRVYNNIKVAYNPSLLDINEIIPGAFRSGDYTLEEVNTILQTDFVRWSGFYNLDYTTNQTFDLENPFTWNYSGALNEHTDTAVTGYWRSFFKHFYDTDRPNTHPWEMLGFSEEPNWWQAHYGPAPYTSGNSILWDDLEKGVIKEGSRAGTDEKYSRPGLSLMLPVDQYGNLVDPSLILVNVTPYNIRQGWVFGDQGPVETAWRRSCYWPFAVQRLLALTRPAAYASLMYDPSSLRKNAAGQWIYQNSFIDLRNVEIYGNGVMTTGYSVYVSEAGRQRSSAYLDRLSSDLKNSTFNLFHKVGGFISKNKLQIIIDAIDPSSTSPGAILPPESYDLILNVSNPIKTSRISGVIVQKSNGKFVVKGYDQYKPYFTIFNPRRNSTTPSITVGGVSEPFVTWKPGSTVGETGLSSADTTTATPVQAGNFYQQGQVVLYGQTYYRTKVSHRSGATFNPANFQSLPSLPIVGGVSVQIANGFESTPVVVPYGKEFDRIQEVYDMIVGYGKWLESQGFIFDDYSSDLNEVINWNLSAKEFLYWTTQNWADNSVITLSPFANKIKYSSTNSVVDNIFDSFYEYSVLKADGLPFPQKGLNVGRADGVCTIETVGTTDGVYFAELNSVQKEHAMVFDNTTVFNDIIYDVETGYRQRRMKVVGFRTGNWDGDYFSPGFVFDRAEVEDWKKHVSYKYGDTVRYGGLYYSAKDNVPAATAFDFNLWVLLDEKPVQDLIPNFEYKINQFEDFYSLDIDNFDSAQQKMSQHLVGYTPRVYLNNIFTNPISQYKFYQGFIKEKGTRNAVKKMAKASIFNLQGETTFTEEWAFRLGQYGSFTSYDELEVGLQEGTFIENPQIVNFVNEKPVNPIDLIFYSTTTNLAITPEDFDPASTFVTTGTNNFVLPNAGYVSFEDITATAYNENSLLDIADSSQIKDGDTIWLGFKSNGSWDVLRYELNKARLVGVYVSNPGADITFVTDYHHGLSVGDIISVTRFNDQVNGVYFVKAIPAPNQIAVASSLVNILNEELLSPGLLYSFRSARAPTYNQLPKDSEMLNAPVGSLFWVDNQQQDGAFKWKVYRKIDNFSSNRLQSGYPTENQQLGFSIAKRSNSNIILSGAPQFVTSFDKGRVFGFVKNGQSSSRLFSYSLNNFSGQFYSSSTETGFGHAVAYSSYPFAGTGYGVAFAGAPSVGNLLVTGTTLLRADVTGIEQVSTEAGAVKISTINPNTSDERTEVVLVSPTYSSYERFGSAIAANNLKVGDLLIGAPGTASISSGSVYYYQTLLPDAGVFTLSTATSGTTSLTVNSLDGVVAGQSVWISGVSTDINGGLTVESVFDDGIVQNIVLSSALPAEVPADTPVQLYTPAGLKTSLAAFTTTNGLLVSYVDVIRPDTSVIGDEYGHAIDMSGDGRVRVISAPGQNRVEAFVDNGSLGVVKTVLTATTFTPESGARFGESVAVTCCGNFVFVGAPFVRNSDDSFGIVTVFRRVGDTFEHLSTIQNPVPGPGMNFGRAVAVDQMSTVTLSVSAIGLNNSVVVEFDNNETVFDSASTRFYDTIENFGTVYIYNRDPEASRFVLAGEVSPPIEVGLVGTNFGRSLAVDSDSVFVGAPSIDSASTSSIYQFTQIEVGKGLLENYKSYGDVTDIEAVQRVRLIDTFNETVIDYLDVIDPIKGKVAGIADQELKYKSAYDPATYSIGTAGVVVDADTSWLDEHVGELWWDLSTVKYVWYEQGDLTYRKNNWGAVFPGATIDVYEWVRTTYLPSEWSEIADTSAGLTEGISGQPKYVDNSSIAVKQVYNSVSNSFSNVYYYWVKNKVTVPNVKNRRVSSYQVASIIADPTGYGLRYAAIISKDAIALANVAPLLVGSRVNLNVAFDKIKNTVQKHTEWTLLEEGSANSMPPALYEKKLFDSLLGKDSLGNLVPDPSLTERTRYGSSIRPRQTLFKDRKEALRTIVEFANSVLLENQITGSYSFKNLNAQELPPDEFSREYDQVVEDNEGLELVDTRYVRTAQLSCTVSNGRIRSVSIDDPGLGYLLPPAVTIDNGDTSAVIETEIGEAGQVVSVTVINPGSGFTSAPALFVRPFSVIVLADTLYNGKWTKFEWNSLTSQWERKQTQKYNTPLYWKYIDWKAENYNEFIDYSYTIDQVYQLDEIEEIIPGQYVKIKNIGDGRFAVVEKAEEGVLGTFGKGYNIVYSQDGTVQILDSLWNTTDSNLGYDQNNTYDQTLFDQTPDAELGYILSALKDDIFVNELKVNWNLLFFKAVKYALTEQKLLDWAFKTSFINVTNYAGLLDQRPVYKLQTSENYEDYLREVKPYHSQIRTFTANHEIFEPSNSFITDFDLPSFYNENTDQFEPVDFGNPLLEQQPWKAWADNYLYTVGSVVVGNGGSGYSYPPQVVIETAPGDTGSGATARAYVSSGRVNKIEVTNPGSGYRVAPRVVLTGGSSVPAVAYAQLTNNKVRTNLIGVKFDRISRSAELGSAEVVDSFVCNGSLNEFTLTWFANPDKSSMVVTLDGELVLSSEFRIEQYQSLYNGYNKDFSKIVFISSVPLYGQVLEVRYSKNIGLYSAVDRIVNFYNPTSGMPGNSLPQLMEGIEYPGVTVTGIPFDYTTDWDVPYSPFGKSSYADGVNYYTKVLVESTSSVGSNSVVVSTVTNISVGQLANIISTLTNKFSKVEVYVTGTDSVNNLVFFDSTLTQTVEAGEVIEFWNYDSNATILDTAIEGGQWNSSTMSLDGALGVNPEEIVIDGEGFFTPNTGYSPEELVSGEVHESVGINVYTRYNEGAPTVYNGVIEVSAGEITTATLSFTPPNVASIFVTFNDRNFAYTTGTDHLTSVNETEFNFNWETNQIVIGPQSVNGKLGYTIVGIGGGRPALEAGVVDNRSLLVNDGSSSAELTSLSTLATVKNAYVTVNGISVPKLSSPSTSTLGFVLGTSVAEPSRAAVTLYNLSTSTSSLVQAWFFGSAGSYFNEFREQQFNVGVDLQDTFELDYPPSSIQPSAANIIVEIDIGDGYRRMQPPFVSYYKVDPSVSIYKVDNNIDRVPGSFLVSGVRAYVNGRELVPGSDYSFLYEEQSIEVRRNLLRDGDVLAVLGIPVIGNPLSEYDIQGSVLRLLTPINNAVLKVTTFANHDDMLVRTESFSGTLNRRFRISRPITNINFMWVTVDGQLLVNQYDYTVMDDLVTVELSDRWALTQNNTVVITSVSNDKLSETVVGYRIFADFFNRTHYKRLSARDSTVLTKPLYVDDTEIAVKDASVLTPPLVSKRIPGVIIINGERIEFFAIEGNFLKQLRRGTLGTSPKDYYAVGTTVIDQSPSQTVPFNDTIKKQSFLTSNSTSTYVISPVDVLTTASLTGGQVLSNGILLSTTSTIDPVNQIEVYYGGRKLRKDGIFVHDSTVSFDSPEATIVGTTATVLDLPITDVMNTAYLVTATNQVWVYTGSVEVDAIYGYVYKGLHYLEPEYTVSVSVNTTTAAIYAEASTATIDLLFDINGDGVVDSEDTEIYTQISQGAYVEGLNRNSNYPTLLEQQITLNITNGVQDNVRLDIVKKEFSKDEIWNDQLSINSTKSILESTTQPARFLQSRLSVLPDSFYYGGTKTLNVSSGLTLTDENNNPLEGI